MFKSQKQKKCLKDQKLRYVYLEHLSSHTSPTPTPTPPTPPTIIRNLPYPRRIPNTNPSITPRPRILWTHPMSSQSMMLRMRERSRRMPVHLYILLVLRMMAM